MNNPRSKLPWILYNRVRIRDTLFGRNNAYAKKGSRRALPKPLAAVSLPVGRFAQLDCRSNRRRGQPGAIRALAP